MTNQTPGSVTYYYGNGADSHWPIFINTTGCWVMSKQGDLDSFSPVLNQITDDANRIESIYTDAGVPVAVDFNQVYNGSGSLISYCETDYDYTVFDPITDNSEGDGDFQGWLQETRTLWVGPDSNNNPTSKIISQNDYTYDNAGLRKTNTISVQQVNANGDGVVDTHNNPIWASQRTESYTYDDLSRLATVNYGDGEQQSYQFDAMGNRTQKWDTITGTTTYGYDATNRLTTLNGNTSAYTYDANGNSLTGGGRTNTWDWGNELTQSVDGSTTSQYDYDYGGLRRQQAVTTGSSSTTTDYGLDCNNVVREWTNTSGTLAAAATYLVGARGIDYKRFDQTGLVDWYVYDGMESVVAEINPNGSVQASQNYDVYGNVRASAGTSQTTNHFVGSLGHSSDQATGLIYMRARYYDPSVGRFISQDPMGEGFNWYLYAADNPTNMVDSSGKATNSVSDTWWNIGLGFAVWACLIAAWAGVTTKGTQKSFGYLACLLAAAGTLCFTEAAVGMNKQSSDNQLYIIATVGGAMPILQLLVAWISDVRGYTVLPGVMIAITSAFAYGIAVLAFSDAATPTPQESS